MTITIQLINLGVLSLTNSDHQGVFLFKKHINLQLGSGIDKLFESLLSNKKINFKNRKRIMDICRDWSQMSTSTGTLPL